MIRLIIAVCLPLGALAAGAKTNLVENGDFSSPLKPAWGGGSFGGGEGEARIDNGKDGNPFAHLEKTKGPGGTQLMSQPVSLQGATRFRFSMRYRRNGGLAFLRYRTREDGRWRVIKGPDGGEVSITLHDLKTSTGGQWLSYERIVDIPSAPRHIARPHEGIGRQLADRFARAQKMRRCVHMRAVVRAHRKGGKIIQITFFHAAKRLLLRRGITRKHPAGENLLRNINDSHH